MKNEDIIAVTMPGFGTSNKTYTNAINLIKYTNATLKEISIVDACKQHYKDIGHDENDYDVTYENAQARERTQILFDLANDLNGIVIGTGDLSELALGWCTYNGDQMSNYGVNVGIPKTLIMTLINKVKDEMEDNVKEVLIDILNTPISPELLPLDENGNILQDSQKSIGPYKLHDFFLHHFLGYGASIKKIYCLACLTFNGEYTKEEIKATLTMFVKRFFTQQFKRNALSDGVKVFEIGLSGRSDFMFNSDVCYVSYLKELENL
jgi:NAD+ synthase (glutamine-hydrolysing)